MFTKDLKSFLLWLLLGVMSRVIPHPANVTALTSLSVLVGRQFSSKVGYALILLTLVISDFIWAYLNHYPYIGIWMLFTYSGFFAITYLGYRFRPVKTVALVSLVLSSSLLFWLWTNFGVWLVSEMYPHTLAGLLYCYAMALPFLRNSMLGDFAWMLVLLSAAYLSQFSWLKLIKLFSKRPRSLI